MSSGAELNQLIRDAVQEKRFELFIKYCMQLYKDSGTHSVPKSLFRPDKIKPALPYISINELISDDIIQVRILGTELGIIFGGREMRGLNALDYIPPENVEASSQFYKMVSAHNLISFLDEDLKLANGKGYRCVTFGMPMCDDAGVNRFRIAISKLDFNAGEHVEPSEFQVMHTKLHNLRFAELSSFAGALNNIGVD
jgi:hypothetical protein